MVRATLRGARVEGMRGHGRVGCVVRGLCAKGHVLAQREKWVIGEEEEEGEGGHRNSVWECCPQTGWGWWGGVLGAPAQVQGREAEWGAAARTLVNLMATWKFLVQFPQ